MTTKLTPIEDPIPSDITMFGGEPLNQIIYFLSGLSVEADEDIRIATMTKFFSGKFAIYEDDPTRLNKLIFKVENIDTGGDKTVTFRNPTVPDDFAVTEDQIQELENKALGLNTTLSKDMDGNNNSIIDLKSVTFSNYPTTDPVGTSAEIPFYRKDLDSNNQALYISKKENGVFIKVRVA